MTTPVKDLPDIWRKRFQGKDLTETDECMDAALRIAATELEASLAAQDDELERLRGFVEELKRLTVTPFGYLTYNGILNLLKKHKLDGSE